MIKAKICGITELEDALIAAKLGAWAIGFIFYEKSPRYITPENALEISKEIKKHGAKVIGVFVNETPENITKIANTVELDYVQLHGQESSFNCNQLKIPFIKNIRSSNEINEYDKAFAFLVDAADTNSWGGTGSLADWELAKKIKAQDKPLILSGGLSSNNIGKALIEVKPDFVDLSSSLEISPGKKNHKLMREFFEKIGKFKENEVHE